MSFFLRKRKNSPAINICVACYVLNIGLLAASPPAAAAVFEEMMDGTINPLVDGAREGVPSTPSRGDASDSAAEIVVDAGDRASASRGAVIFDSPVNMRRETRPGLVLPKPNRMARGSRLSPEQRRMQKMAAEIALSYSRRPGVLRAQLSQTAFVTLFTTMIRRESNFNPRAVSPVGAKGLGQLMPQTARELGVCDVFSPRENLEGAAIYLTSMMARFGSPEVALAAYNAGPGAVTRHRGMPPYKETRQYVADIMEAARTPPGTMPEISLNTFAYRDGDGTRHGNILTVVTDEPRGHSREASGCMKLRTGGILAEE